MKKINGLPHREVGRIELKKESARQGVERLGKNARESHGAYAMASKMRGFIQGLFTTPASARVLNQERLGVIYQNAIGVYERALEKDREILGENHPDTAIDYNNLGEAWNSLGDYQKAIANFEKALAILREAFPEGHPRIRQVEANLAAAKRGKNEHERVMADANQRRNCGSVVFLYLRVFRF